MFVEKIFNIGINSVKESDLKTIIGIPESHNIEFKTIPDIDQTLNSSRKKKEETHHKKIY